MNKKYFWSVIGVATIFSLWFSYVYFDKAIPFVKLSITMNKKQAEQEAHSIVQKYNWNIQGFDQAVQFESNSVLQTFAELEGGGKQAYIDMIDQGHHQPYSWRVRFFKEKEILETFVWFTPTGEPYGFSQKLPEDQVGKNISKSNAEKIVQSGLDDWGVNAKPYKLVEYEEQVRPAGRVDHTFTYEREDASLKKGLYRLKATVAGDQLTELKHFVKIPDEFNRRYAQMFSVNTMIAIWAQVFKLLFYIFIIGLCALWVLYNRRYLLTAKICKMMGVFASLMLLYLVNQWALVWNNYHTMLSKSMFVVQQLGMIVLWTLLLTVLVGFVCLVAESASRYVFKGHIQWFKLWDNGVAGSYSIAEQTALGYCGAVMMLAYALGFGMLAEQWGWWVPMYSKVDPNILSNYAPFLSPSLKAFYAGFFEEFLFRALPIAGVLLLTKNWKRNRGAFWGIILLQALIFGAVHANYPMQPAYYRIVEILIPSFGFAWLYYTFGLLPGIVMHSVYDWIIFVIPIFSSNLLLQKIFAIFMAGIPLWVVLIHWIRQGHLKSLTKTAYNEAWKATVTPVKENVMSRDKGAVIASNISRYTWFAGAVGLVLFAMSSQWHFDTPQLRIAPDEAKGVAQKVIKKEFGDIGLGWDVLYSVEDTSTNNAGNKFIWQTYGKEVYKKLQGSYVVEPYYSVRIVKFDGPVETRAEEYGAWIAGDGRVLNVWHNLPEAAEGADISESKAQSIAYDIIKQRYDLPKSDIELVSSDSVKHENRRDWTIVVQDKQYTYDKGQARIKVSIAGDHVSRCYQYIHAPEDWTRKEGERLTKNGLIQGICKLLMLLFYGLFIALCFRRNGVSIAALKKVAVVGIALFLLKIISFFNVWNSILFMLSTAAPLINQMSSIVVSSLLFMVAGTMFVATLLVYVLYNSKQGVYKQVGSSIVTGIAAGCLLLGIWSFIFTIQPLFMAHAPEYDFVKYKSSMLAMLLQVSVTNMIWLWIGVAAVMYVAQYIKLLYKKEWLVIGLFALSGIVSAGTSITTTIPFWLLLGAVSGTLWYVLCRYIYQYNVELLFFTVATVELLRLLPSAWYKAYPFMLIDIVVVAVITLSIAGYFYKRLQTAK